ncbi:DNA uptake protein [Idiomarina tyrosinivorans]|uniref:DNA uptake protein n=2 Tax=Idiomarina tyrosinivorans TaxID=1445662 RepID=A0A432ZUJ0_9GAMM|nr:DNA uptake protein [Idiomarina tyrosinivorans]
MTVNKYLTSVALAAALTCSSVVLPLQAATVPQQQTVDESIDINTASPEAIAAAMRGVGLRKAERIVALREKLGGFTSLEQLLEVKGIGQRTLEKNKANLRLK